MSMEEGTEFGFGEALARMREGKAVTRKALRGTSFIVMMPALQLPSYNTQDTSRKVNDRTAKWIGEDKPLDCQPYVSMYITEGNVWQPGWVPSQMDMFAEDWVEHSV